MIKRLLKKGEFYDIGRLTIYKVEFELYEEHIKYYENKYLIGSCKIYDLFSCEVKIRPEVTTPYSLEAYEAELHADFNNLTFRIRQLHEPLESTEYYR